MRAQIKSKTTALIALVMAFVFAFSLSSVPSFASADQQEGAEDKPISASGIDFMQTTGWELFKVDSLEFKAIYITVYKDGVPLSNPIKYTDEDYKESSDQIAQIISVNMPNGQTPKDLLSDPNSIPNFKVVVSDAFMGGKTIYEGKIYPVYAKVVESDGSSSMSLMGIRTTNDSSAAKNMGVGQSYYKQKEGADRATSYSLQLTNGIDNRFVDGNKFVVTYEENPAGSIEGAIRYVDATTGEVVKTVTVTGINNQTKTTAPIMKSFSATDPADKTKTTSYRVISSLAGTSVALDLDTPYYTVQVMKVEGLTYPVTIKYVDEDDNLLWSDSVDVKGQGYRYTIPNTFSMNKNSQVESAEGVNFFRLSEVIGGGAGSADAITTQEGQDASATPSSIKASDANGTLVYLTNDLTDADFVMDENNTRTIKAVYQSDKVTKKVDFTLIEIDGETGKEIGRVVKSVTPDASFNYTPGNIVVNGKNYVPWAGNTEKISYDWEKLANSNEELMQRIYYVPEDYKPGDPYDFSVQYVNIADGSVLHTQTFTADPANTNYINIVGESSFTQNSNEYVRLAGQDSAIRHTYFSPHADDPSQPTYTIYYRDVNDTINANRTIVRTQIIETTLGGGAGTIDATITPVDDAAAPGDAGVGAGDGTVIINDDDNPLANNAGQDTTTERTIEDNENPLASGALAQNPFAMAGIVLAVLAVIGVDAYLFIRRRNKKATDKMNA